MELSGPVERAGYLLAVPGSADISRTHSDMLYQGLTVEMWLQLLAHIKDSDADVPSCSSAFYQAYSSAVTSYQEECRGHLLPKPPLRAVRRNSALCFLRPTRRSLSLKTALLSASTLASQDSRTVCWMAPRSDPSSPVPIERKLPATWTLSLTWRKELSRSWTTRVLFARYGMQGCSRKRSLSETECLGLYQSRWLAGMFICRYFMLM